MGLSMDQNWGTLNNGENADNTDHNQRNKNTEEADDWKSNLIQVRDPLTTLDLQRPLAVCGALIKDEISTNEDNFGNLDQLLDDDLHAISPEHYDLVEAGDVPGSPNNENWAKPPFKNQYMLKRGGKRTSGGKPKKMRLEGFKLEENDDEDDNDQDLECESETFECKICGDSYDSEEKLKKHLQSNKVWNGGTFLKCAKCQKGFHTESALNKHVAHGHPELLFDRSPAISFNTVSKKYKTN